MLNNDVLRRVRYVFDFSDAEMIHIFSLGNMTVDREIVSNWLKKEDAEDYKVMDDAQLATFLNGLIIRNRGAKDGETPIPEELLNNNLMLRKLKIALEFKDTDILDIIALSGFSIGKHELSAFFRKPGHKNYRNCNDQVLRNFLMGLQLKYRP